MSREVRRVPVNFDWPLDKVWDGYLMPDRFDETPCPDCKNGYSRHAEHLFNLWYGYEPFTPADTGSEPLQPRTPGVWAFAERNVTRSPDYYGTGETAIFCEALRLANIWNGQWCHHLTQDDVDALVAGDRLWDFTSTWAEEDRWQPKDPPVHPTAAEVNAWSLSGFGHDSINASIVIKARCKRDGQPLLCGTCGGHGSLEKWKCQRIRAELWEPTEPPTGDGWQLWETVSEGSPVTPVFATREGLVEHLSSSAYRNPLTRDEAEGLVDAGWVPSMIATSAGVLPGEQSAGDFARVVHGIGTQPVRD
ncbi:hypothetical protein [Nocardia sp. NPDC060249]|uniref:hypothetical protein n=1 Tax=Nocardia sp. NPDC060249 TaxID=3347082 RepID=UPI003645FC72